MFSIRWWIILSNYVYLLVLMLVFNTYLKKKVGEGLGGHRKIPKNLRVIFFFGFIGAWIITLFPIIFLFYPNIVNISFPIPIFQKLIFEIFGISITILGVLIITISIIQLGTSARFLLPKQKTKLVTSGVYRFSRNPLYIGAYLVFIGLFLLLPSIIYLIGLFLFFILQHFRILQEEQFLKDTFGVEYENYMKKVGRYFPKIHKNKE